MMMMNFIVLISDHTHFHGVSNLNSFVVDADANTSVPGASHAAQCSSSITPTRVKRHITTRWQFNDYVVFETSTDGNCLFDALSHQLVSVCSIAKTAQSIRREVTEYVRCHPDLRDILWLSTDALEGLQVEQYLKQMKTAGLTCWGDGIMLTPASMLYNTAVTVKGKKVKVHTLDIAPLRNESPLHKRSGMARVLKGFHSFTCTPTRSSAIGMSQQLSWKTVATTPLVLN